ncbi:MAG: acetyl-CoA carboxylase biotin carboxyl carrier protein [Candidatus Eiseniibacteriota bacterium]
MNEDELKRLIRLVEESDIDELEIDRPFGRIRITKRRAEDPPPVARIDPRPAPPAEPVTPSAPPPAVSPAPAGGRDPSLVAIAAPMVGTFYSAPAPGAKPYVSVGDTVGVGQVVCIVEAMKLMNEVQSEVAGRITQVCVENGQAVEYGQEIYLVTPA